MYYARLEPVSQGSDWITLVKITDEETGEPVDLRDMEITASIACNEHGYPILSGDTNDGTVSVPDDGLVLIQFMADRMANITPRDYRFGLTFRRSGFTESLLVGQLPVIDGVIRKW